MRIPWCGIVMLLGIIFEPGEGYRESQENPYNVLILAPIGSRSLYHLTKSLSKALGDAGHSVTLVSSFRSSGSNRHLNVTEIYSGATTGILEEDPNVFKMQSTSSMFKWLKDAITSVGNDMWSNENIKELWERRNDFDAIVIISYVNEIAVPFLLDYKGVYINLCTPGVEYFTMSFQGNWLSLAVTPSITLPYDEYMSFFERLVNPLSVIMVRIMYYLTVLPLAQTTLEQFFPEIPPLLELYEDSHLTLINGHYALDGPVPLLPNQVEIGTINAEPAKPLPQDLEEFSHGSGDEGIIYFSIGSIAKSKDMPMEIKSIFVEAFKRIPQRVIWKYEGNDLDLPSNVITRKWLPQQDILGHPKTRLFISHCGNLGTQEAKYHGVPVLAVPVAFDQPRNAARLARKGYGLVLNWEDMTVEAIVTTIQTLINDPKYSLKIKQVSQLLKNQKESPAERAVWWVEYTIRYLGGESSPLEFAGKKLHVLQYMMVDVIAFWLTAVFMWNVFLYYVCVRVYRYCYTPQKEKIKKTKLN